MKSVSGFVLLTEFPPLTKHIPRKRSYVERSFYTMGTVVTISAYGESRSHVNHAINRAVQEIQRVDDMMSLYKSTSQLVEVNKAAGYEPVKVHKDLARVIESAKTWHELTSGFFDITVEPLMELWGFRSGIRILEKYPSEREIQQRLDAVGFRHVSIDGGRNFIGLDHPGSKLDLGGIAVGYSVDLAVGVLKSEGIDSAFINHGGDAYALGKPDDEESWRLGIPNPSSPEEILVSFTLSDKAVSTSANYEKFVQLDSHRYGHIVNPRTGIPSDRMLSATVISPSAMEADALSTAFFSMGEERAEKAIRTIGRTETVLVTSDGKWKTLAGERD